jgi:hypothetical protein
MAAMPPIRPDLIPFSSHGSSLNNLLTKSSWDAIRLPVFEAADGRCRICAQRSPLECHELWAYSLPPAHSAKGTVGVQRLMALAALCKQCHAIFHMGYARMSGTFGEVKARLIAVNRWSEAEFAAYDAEQVRLGMLRSEFNWALDLSLVADGPPLVVDTGPRGWKLDEDEGFLTSPPRASGRPGWTFILGAPYRLGSRLMPAIHPREAMEGLLPEEGDFEFARRCRTDGQRVTYPATPP